MRRYSQVFRVGVVAAAALGAAACGKGSNSGSSGGGGGGTNTPANAAGIWVGTDGSTGDTMEAFITQDGVASFIRSDGSQFIGTLTVNGANISATLDGYPQFGTTFSDTPPSTSGTGTLSGTVLIGSSITATFTFTTASGDKTEGTITLDYQAIYETPYALATIAGSYAIASQPNDPLNGSTVTISSSGAISGTSASTGCTLSGKMAASDPSYDLFDVSLTYSGCTSPTFKPLNGVALSGLSVYVPTSSPAGVQIAVTGMSTATGTPTYSLVSVLILN